MSYTALHLGRLQGCRSTAQMATYQLAAESYPALALRTVSRQKHNVCLLEPQTEQLYVAQTEAIYRDANTVADCLMKETQKQTSRKYSQHITHRAQRPDLSPDSINTVSV